MPSTLVHISLGLLLAVGVLGNQFTGRHAVIIAGATALPDLDVALEVVFSGAHRAVGHTFVLPALLILGLVWETQWRQQSLLRQRYGDSGVEISFLAVGCMFAAGIVPDLVVGGVNIFYPLHDAFITVDGRLLYSTDRGWVQTFIESSTSPDSSQLRTTENFEFRTVIDAEPTLGTDADSGGGESGQPQVERIFPVAMTGFRGWLLPLATAVISLRLYRARRERTERDAVANITEGQ
ncbi:metal-dependent hydrolase [Haloquadratum walsbyi]|uniref:Membrane-bound metal-dependent hydrolase (DUF457) n=1 Tax=Haloquadratum walsbyi J07HQW2 TaxID=1238425 RepID=U1NEA3_9EURY|nr:metal-dependent hydrolase [Haloquadratum walsbyi]ERG95083.1 MAG: hypothetical protein J07HQW2_01528 [Haloquadratum walsbyi J07HQW2]